MDLWEQQDEGMEGGYCLEYTHDKEMDRWNLCLRPRNMTKDFGGKERAVTVQYGRS